MCLGVFRVFSAERQFQQLRYYLRKKEHKLFLVERHLEFYFLKSCAFLRLSKSILKYLNLFWVIIHSSGNCCSRPQGHRIIQDGRDLRRSLVQPPAGNRIICEIRLGSSGIYPAGCWKPPNMHKPFSTDASLSLWEFFFLSYPVWTSPGSSNEKLSLDLLPHTTVNSLDA